MTKQTKVSETIVKPQSGREANPVIMESGTFTMDGFSIPKLGVCVEGKSAFTKHMFLLGLCKVLGDNVANEKDKPAAIQQTFEAWNHGYPTYAAWEKSKRAAVTVVAGKPAKLQFTQLEIATALRDLNGLDDPFAAFFATLDDDQFQVIMDTLDDVEPHESKPVKDALAKLQADSLAKLEAQAEKEKANKLAQARALMAKVRQG